MASSIAGHLDCVQALMPFADVNMQSDPALATALILAVIGDQKEIVQYLLDNDADPNIFSFDNKSAITIAEENNNYDILDMLQNSHSN